LTQNRIKRPVLNFEGEPTGKDNPELLKMKCHHNHNNSIINSIPRIGFMKGGDKAKWVDENTADTFLIRAQHYVKAHKKNPFYCTMLCNSRMYPAHLIKDPEKLQEIIAAFEAIRGTDYKKTEQLKLK